MTRLVCPYTELSAETAEALEPFEVEFYDVGESDTAYYELLSWLWYYREDFVVVEQDIVPGPGFLDSFEACSRVWCAAPYQYLGSPRYCGLGCTRFRATLSVEYPDLIAAAGARAYPGHGPGHWCTLDAAIQRELAYRVQMVCSAHEPVGHLHGWPTHNCVPRR